ncbi:MAG TPA: MFS transporter, partial [Jatrophihabitans sp.]|nr:MFS transporter [Jatrophihabitans sp.]
LPPSPVTSLATRMRVLANPRVVAVVLVMLTATAASIGVYTFIAEVLDDSAKVHGLTLAAVLLVWGAGGAVGSFGSGWLTDRFGSFGSLSCALVLLTLTLLAIPVAASVAAVFVVMALNGAAGWALATPNNHRLTVLEPALPSVVISFNSAGIYLGQAVGAVIGGFYLRGHHEPRLLPLLGALVAALALAMHLVLTRPSGAAVTAE